MFSEVTSKNIRMALSQGPKGGIRLFRYERGKNTRLQNISIYFPLLHKSSIGKGNKRRYIII